MAARRGEGSAGQLFGIQAVGRMLRRIASRRQSALQSFGRELLAETRLISKPFCGNREGWPDRFGGYINIRSFIGFLLKFHAIYNAGSESAGLPHSRLSLASEMSRCTTCASAISVMASRAKRARNS